MKRIFTILLFCIVYNGFSQKQISEVTLSLKYDTISQTWDTLGLSKNTIHYKYDNQVVVDKISFENWSFTNNNSHEYLSSGVIYTEESVKLSEINSIVFGVSDLKIDSSTWYVLDQDYKKSPVFKYKSEYNDDYEIKTKKTYDKFSKLELYSEVDSIVTIRNKDKKLLSETHYRLGDSSATLLGQAIYEYDNQGKILSKNLFGTSDDQLYLKEISTYFYENNRLSKWSYVVMDSDNDTVFTYCNEYINTGNPTVNKFFRNDVLVEIDSTFYDIYGNRIFQNIYSYKKGYQEKYLKNIYFEEYPFSEGSSVTPLKPGNFRVAEVQSNDSFGKGGFIKLVWQDLAINEDIYIVYRNEEGGDFYFYKSLNANTSFFVDSSVVDSIEYSYFLVAINERTNGYKNVGVISDTIKATTSMHILGQSEENDLVIHIYPNPATEIIYIDNVNIDVVSLIDMNGKVVLEGNENSLDVYDLNLGIYILQAIDDNGRMYKQLITKE